MSTNIEQCAGEVPELGPGKAAVGGQHLPRGGADRQPRQQPRGRGGQAEGASAGVEGSEIMSYCEQSLSLLCACRLQM